MAQALCHFVQRGNQSLRPSAENMTEGSIDGHLVDRAARRPDLEVDRLVEQLPQHLVEQEPLLGPLLATQRPNTEVTTFFLMKILARISSSSGGVHSDRALPSDSD